MEMYDFSFLMQFESQLSLLFTFETFHKINFKHPSVFKTVPGLIIQFFHFLRMKLGPYTMLLSPMKFQATN